jgi:hypothetical protein
MVPWSHIEKERASVWQEAADIAMAHGQVDLARQYEALAEKELKK